MRVKGHMQIQVQTQVKSVCFTGVNQWRRKIFLQMNMWLQAHFAISSSRILKNLGWGGGGGGADSHPGSYTDLWFGGFTIACFRLTE